ncbi:MAG: hypothetical protein WCR08_14335 [Gammaproteobacteria bacterium]
MAKAIGFSAIYFDSRGFESGGSEIENEIEKLVGKPFLISSNGFMRGFFLAHKNLALKAGTVASKIMKVSDYSVGLDGLFRYSANLNDLIYFGRGTNPSFISEIEGLSTPEGWGRWSDNRLNRKIVIHFEEILPTRFHLSILIRPFGPNKNKPLIIKVGNFVSEVTPTSDNYLLNIDINQISAISKSIEITPSNPTSPTSLGLGSDDRLIGIGLISMKLTRTKD